MSEFIRPNYPKETMLSGGAKGVTVRLLDKPFQVQQGPIGEGGASHVYLGEDATNNLVIAKLLKAGEDPTNEIKMHERLSGHPNVIKLIDSKIAETPQEQSHLILEYAPWGNFAELVPEHGVVLPTALPHFLEAIQGIGAANAARIALNDIKPSNILLGEGGVAKISDLGIATDFGADPTSLPVKGTAQYLAPERLRGETVGDDRSDLYSVALTLYDLLSGKRPFGALPLSTIFALLNTGHSFRPLVDILDQPVTAQHKAITDTLGQAMSSDPADRQTNVGEFADELEQRYHGAKEVTTFEVPGLPKRQELALTDARISDLVRESQEMQTAFTRDEGNPRMTDVFEQAPVAVPSVRKLVPRTWKAKAIGFVSAAAAAVPLLLGILPTKTEQDPPSLSENRLGQLYHRLDDRLSMQQEAKKTRRSMNSVAPERKSA